MRQNLRMEVILLQIIRLLRKWYRYLVQLGTLSQCLSDLIYEWMLEIIEHSKGAEKKVLRN